VTIARCPMDVSSAMEPPSVREKAGGRERGHRAGARWVILRVSMSKGDESTETWVFERELVEPIGILRVVEGPDLGSELVFGEDAVTIGKSEGATLRLSDPTVSRLHLSLTRADGLVLVRDLGSKNGTWIGPVRIGEASVPTGTRLHLGATEITLAMRTQTVRRSQWMGGDRLGSLVGSSPAMHKVFARLARMAHTDSRVLVRGESGTGKELAARTLHEIGLRASGPLVIVDAAAIADTLAEDELFGHVPGAFTGATSVRIGAFERAHGGTIFLDEIGDLPLSLQAKLLRTLEDGTVQRLGSGERIAVDVRVIAATHKPLEQMVNERTFREDLYYRLAVLDVCMPSLRERPADIPLLAREILRGDLRDDAPTVALVEAALAEHHGYAWPGNVRELRNFVRRVAVLGREHAQLHAPIHEGAHVHAELPFQEAKEKWVEHFQRKYVERVLEETGGNVTEAARRSGISRVHLSNLAGRLGLRRVRD
jgi:DNA-binding NtrC family response regulator